MNREDQFSSTQNFWIGVLSFFIPVVGIVLSIIWWQERHHTAKIALICALIAIGLVVLLVILSIAVVFFALSNVG